MRTFFKYRTHAYDLASKIGRDADIYDQFNKGFQKSEKEIYDTVQGKVYDPKKNPIVTLLDLFNELENVGEITVTEGDCDFIVNILNYTGDNECKILADEFKKKLREVEREEITDSGAQKAFCFFLRNEDINGDKLVDYLKWSDYKNIFKKLGIEIKEINQYLLKEFIKEINSINKRIISKSNFDLILVILIGYNDSDPIDASFMMNEEIGKKKQIKWYDIHHDLIRPMKMEFHDKKMIFVNITQSLVDGRDKSSMEVFYKNQPGEFLGLLPKNIAYLHIHANEKSPIERLFEKMNLKAWLYSEDLVHKLAEVGKYDFKTVTKYNPQQLGLNHATTETDAILNVYQPKKVIVIKIKINGTETKESNDFCEYSLGYEKNVYSITLKTDGEEGEKSYEELKKKIKEKTKPEKKYDLFVFAFCSKASMPLGFYQDAVNLWSSALDNHALTKPKILIIDVTVEGTLEMPEISTPETLIICLHYREHITHEQMFLERLVQELEEDAHRNYDLMQHVKTTFNHVGQGTQFFENFSKGIYLKEEKKVGK